MDPIYAWIQQLYLSYVCDENEEGTLPNEHSQEDVLLEVAGFIMQMTTPSFQDVYAFLNNLYYMSEGLNSQSDEFMEFLLFYAVSESCEKRMECVQTMMEMEEEVQVTLMEIIQMYLEKKESLMRENIEACEVIASNEGDKEEESTPTGSTIDKTCLDAASCAQCSNLLEEIDHVRSEITLQAQKYHKESNECKQRLVQAQNKLEDSELLLLTKNQEIHALQTNIADYEANISDMEDRLAVLAQSQMSSLAVQDELEVLRPLAAQAQAYEAQIVKLKEKLEDLASIKQQYMQETESHQITYSKLLELEKQVEELIENKKLVEKYRDELAEIYVANQEHLENATKYKNQVEHLRSQNEKLQAQQSEFRREQQSLSQQIDIFSEEARSSTHFHNISEGLSEFNPVLMQELMSLRQEKLELFNKLDSSSLESLHKLEKENADIKCIYNNVQGKYMQTKEQLANAEKKIASLQEQYHNLDISKKELMRRYQEVVSMYDEELIAHKSQHRHFKLHSEKQFTAQFELLRTANNSKRKLEVEEHEEEVKRLKQSNEDNLQTLNAVHSDQIATLKQSHSEAITQEQQQCQAIQSMLEDETSKRRRMERMKRLLEVEVQRLKVQVSAAGTGASSGLDEGAMGTEMATAAKEMKAMQETIDGQQKEIQQLKQQLASMQYTGHSAVNTHSNEQRNASGQTSALHSKAMRVNSNYGSTTSSTASSSHTFLEQVEFHDKRLEQLAKEKREILSKSLEDNKEKMELSQKLMIVEKENSGLKNELRKVRLEKERLERKMWKEGKITDLNATEDKENASNSAF